MDNVRNMVGSPIAGLDPEEMVDTRQLCTEISDMVTDGRRGNAVFANLPRKINIAISGGRDDFAHTMINDVGLQPHEHPDTGEVGRGGAGSVGIRILQKIRSGVSFRQIRDRRVYDEARG